MKKELLLILFLFFFTNILCAKDSIRVAIIKGSTVEFIFKSYYEYENEINYSDWTEIQVSFGSTTTGNTWMMSLEAQGDGAGNFIAYNDQLPLSVVSIDITLSSGGIVNTPWEMKEMEEQIITFGPEGGFSDNLVTLGYTCKSSAADELLNAPPAYYSAVIVATFSAPGP